MEPEEWKRLVGDHVRERRQSLGITSMRKAAKKARFSEAVWRQLESGKRQVAKGQYVTASPSTETQAAVCRVLGWSPDSIGRLLDGLAPIEVAIVNEVPTPTADLIDRAVDLLAEASRQIRAEKQ